MDKRTVLKNLRNTLVKIYEEDLASTEAEIPIWRETTSAAGYVFICYSHRDQDFVLALARQLQQRGVVVWVDQGDIDPGVDWNDAIDAALRGCTHLLVVLAPAFIDSLEAKADLRLALDEKKTIVPVLYQL